MIKDWQFFLILETIPFILSLIIYYVGQNILIALIFFLIVGSLFLPIITHVPPDEI